MAKKYFNTVEEIGELVRQTWKAQRTTQAQLALLAGTDTRFISDLEIGKSTTRWDRADE